MVYRNKYLDVHFYAVFKVNNIKQIKCVCMSTTMTKGSPVTSSYIAVCLVHPRLRCIWHEYIFIAYIIYQYDYTQYKHFLSNLSGLTVFHLN